MNCSECQAYDADRSQCHRYPTLVDYIKPSHWCLEFKAREVIVCPVVEERKEEKARVEEKAESELVIPEIKRGWPKGKPRK